MKTLLHSKKARSQSAFSLIEPTLAFGIVTISLLAMVAMTSGVIETSGETADRFATSRIFQSIEQDFQMKDWKTISTLAGGDDIELRYYDEKGEEVKKTDFEAVYVTRITLKNAPLFPGISSAAQSKIDERAGSRQESRRVQIEISSRIQLADPFSDPRYLTEFSTLIVKLDR